MKRLEVTKARPYNYDELMHNSYNVQNMLITQFNFPLYFHKGDFMSDIWIDRIPREKYEEAYKKNLEAKMGGGGWDNPHLNPEIVLGFFQDIFSECNKKLTGFRIVRYTNVASGYPCPRFDVFAKSPETPNEKIYSGQSGENVEGNEPMRNDIQLIF